MSDFSNELSPIHMKDPRKWYYYESIPNKIDIKDIFDISHHHLAHVESINTSQLEQKVITTAKTIIYLFTPEIDLLQRLENDIHNYDKFQKTKLILKEFINSILTGRLEMETEVLKTSEEMSRVFYQFQHLKKVVGNLQGNCQQKDQQIQKYKNKIIQLTKAYEQAKFYYQQELLELTFQLDEFKLNINEKDSKKNNSKSVQKSKDYNVYLRIPKEQKQKQTDLYTDRNLYRRFSVNNLQESENVLNSMNKEQQINNNINLSIGNSMQTSLQKNSFERQTLKRKLNIIEQEYKLMADNHTVQIQQLQKRIEQLQQKIQNSETQLQRREIQIKQKNKIINSLLQIIDKKK